SIDRVTRTRVMVPKPYFTLENGELRLHNVPVAKTRPPATIDPDRRTPAGIRGRIQRMALDPRLQPLRNALRERAPQLQAEMYRLAGFQPYPEYDADTTDGWRLLEAIVRQFVAEAAPVPVLVVAVPTPEYFQYGARPNYLPLMERFHAPGRGVHVVDITTPLMQLPWEERYALTFRRDVHFSAGGHRKVADLLADAIVRDGLLTGARRTSAPT